MNTPLDTNTSAILDEIPVRDAVAQFQRSQMLRGDCAVCGKPVVTSAHHPSPVVYCACPAGPIDRPNQWQVVFVRVASDNRALAYLKPASGIYAPFLLHAKPSSSDAQLFQNGRGFEWAEISDGSRRLAFTILALVADLDRADRYADAFVREYLAVKIAKRSEYAQAITLGEVKHWLSSHEATEGAAA